MTDTARQPALKRIRLAEAPDDEGAKRVWHGSGDGTDLTTHVDGDGRALFQELTFGKGLSVDWDRDRGVRTGVEETIAFKSGRAGHSRFRYHQPPAADVLDRAIAAVGPAGDDRYLQHFVAICQNALEALRAAGPDTVTTGRRPPGLPPLAPDTLLTRVRRWLRL